MAIYMIGIAKRKKGKVIGVKMVSAKSKNQILKGPKSRYVGSGRYIVGVVKTRMKGTVRKRSKMSRSKRFGRFY